MLRRIPLIACFLLLCGWLGSAAAAEARQARFPSEAEIGDPSQVPDGYTLFEGDILLRNERLNKAGGFVLNFWPGGDVPYQWDAGLAQARRDTMVAAMAILEAVANVNFRPRSGEADYVHIKWHASLTNAELGLVGGRQLINVADGATMWNLVHELMHCLGVVHEQSRQDRDGFVDIKWAQIHQTFCNGPCDSNFQIDFSTWTYGYYDFDSIMHYGQFAFAIGSNPTIVCKAGFESWQNRIGQRGRLSALDVLTISFLYPEGNWRFVDEDASPALLQLGAFLLPWDTFLEGMGLTPSGGRLHMQPGDYAGIGVYDEPIEIRAPLGGVTID